MRLVIDFCCGALTRYDCLLDFQTAQDDVFLELSFEEYLQCKLENL
jgi:hypothetical protein